jgi:hypothetical protein
MSKLFGLQKLTLYSIDKAFFSNRKINEFKCKDEGSIPQSVKRFEKVGDDLRSKHLRCLETIVCMETISA